MANKQNLTGTPIRSGEEAARKGRKGGIASGASRRRKRTLREELLSLLDTTKPTKDGDKTLREIISIGLLKRAAAGDPHAFKTIRDTIGEDVIAKIDVTSDGMPIQARPTEIHVAYNGQEFVLTGDDVE